MPPECDIQRVGRSSNIHPDEEQRKPFNYETISFVNSYLIITMTKKFDFLVLLQNAF